MVCFIYIYNLSFDVREDILYSS